MPENLADKIQLESKITRIKNLYNEICVYRRAIVFLEVEVVKATNREEKLKIHETIDVIEEKIAECDKHIKRELGL